MRGPEDSAGGFLDEGLRRGLAVGLTDATDGLIGVEEETDDAPWANTAVDADGEEDGDVEVVVAAGLEGADFWPQFSFVLHLGSKHMVKERLPLRWTDTIGVPQESQILFKGLISASRGSGYSMRHAG